MNVEAEILPRDPVVTEDMRFAGVVVLGDPTLYENDFAMAEAIYIAMRRLSPLSEDDDHLFVYPKMNIEFCYTPGHPAYTPRGEYAPIDPPEAPEIEFVSAILISNHGLTLTRKQIDEWASDFLISNDGYDAACRVAEDDR